MQALLAERKLPFAYKSYKKTTSNFSPEINAIIKSKDLLKELQPTQKPGDILRRNLEQLAKAENITPSQAI